MNPTTTKTLRIGYFNNFCITIFTNTILSCFGQRAVNGRSPTAIGIIIQGIFLIIFYILFATLIKKGVI